MVSVCRLCGLGVVSVGCLLAVGGVKARAQAQVMPDDSDAWRGRCTQYLDGGTVPAPDTSGITAQRYEELARDRSGRNQHFVACNLYLSAAAAQAAMGQTQPETADVMLAKVERKLALGQKLSFSEKLTRASAAMIAASKPAAPPNALEASAVNMLVMPQGAPGMMPGGMPMQQGMGMQPGAMPSQGMMGGPQGQPMGGTMTLGGAPDPGQGQGMAMASGGQPMQGGAMTLGAAPGGVGMAQPVAASVPMGGTAALSKMNQGAGRNGGQYRLPPIGRYTCYAGGMSVLANGMGYNPMTIHVAGFNGYLSILDRTHYAGTDSRDTGTYAMNGNDVVPQSGPYKRVPAALHYVADGQYHRPTMFVQWLDDSGKPMGAGSMICTWDGPPK